ncbi:NAD(P)/FAD-dependent oxidoreductase [Candidatus Nanohalobium constans]|uniref:Pyridine nucleotide-disulfide oxidoreductase, NADH oxidase n=1 Tax=Candidatus Nanohalobium constans TaxID=2565781 RepID=A0A5Q0UJL2_9ARCH|nr:FAD/NAD(P)-binding oxidoreductase [Candidatus Nanohalobium constans]QGA81009.1 pyridine nucleotide-disulfide oxidoreductase, NADH oxidase [Candidatus Nanohalobium constans]
MTKRYIIIGDGIAGATAAENIRDRDEDAEIKVFTDEDTALYNRIMLKNYMKGTLPKQYTQMHDMNWYEKRDIDLHLETRVEEVDTMEKVVSAGDEDYSYDKLLVATGGAPRKLPQDENFENLHYMWTMNDATEIKESAEEAEEAVVVGGGLLGIDLAMAYASNDCETHYLIRGSNWWRRGLDEEGAEIIHQKMEEKGVNVVTETEVSSLEGGGEVEKVISQDGREFECDEVAVAIGQTPNSDIIDVEKNEVGMIKTDEYLETSAEGVFAAGNMVEYESPVFEKRAVNGSWDHSEAMGERAGANMVGEKAEFDFVNTYGVGHFDVQFLAIGDWNGEPVSKKYSEDEYRRLFFDGDRLVGAVMIGYTKGQKELKSMIKEKKEVNDKEELISQD